MRRNIKLTNQFSEPPIPVLLNVQKPVGDKSFPDVLICAWMHQCHSNYIVA